MVNQQGIWIQSAMMAARTGSVTNHSLIPEFKDQFIKYFQWVSVVISHFRQRPSTFNWGVYTFSDSNISVKGVQLIISLFNDSEYFISDYNL